MAAQALIKLEGFEVVRDGSVRRIMLSSKVMKDYEKAMEGKDQKSVGQRRTFERLFEYYCEEDRPINNDQQFKKEGNFGAEKEPVWAFKAFQFRLYGTPIRWNGKETFFAVRADPSKKQNKADRRLLEATAAEVSELRKELDGRGRR